MQGRADKLPYVTVVDEGLSLKQYQMRSYPGKNLMEERAIFLLLVIPSKKNYRKHLWESRCTIANFSSSN